MSFNPAISKQAQEVIFSKRSHKFTHPPVFFDIKQKLLKTTLYISAGKKFLKHLPFSGPYRIE